MAMKPIKVSQLNSYIKRVLQTDPLLGNVSVIGEVSNLKYHQTGVYFSLKDERSKINCYVSPEVQRRLRYQLGEGVEVTVYGYINLYEPGGTYSINVREVDIQGAGNLAVAFEKLKQKLLAEGLFDEEHKKPLPFFPEKIAVVTSPTGAAVNDIKKIITEKNDYVDIMIYPVLVQGHSAAADIANAIEQINLLFPEIDVMIVGRGGGSAEELWAFNEEIVARAVFASKIPVISAVGHETDFTITDFVADRRAETPTAAAHMAAPDISELKKLAAGNYELLQENLRRGIAYREAILQSFDAGSLKKRLMDRLELSAQRCGALCESGKASFTARVSRSEQELARLIGELEALSPQNIINRGYAAITDTDGRLITSAAALSAGDVIRSVLKDGAVISQVTEIEIRR